MAMLEDSLRVGRVTPRGPQIILMQHSLAGAKAKKKEGGKGYHTFLLGEVTNSPAVVRVPWKRGHAVTSCLPRHPSPESLNPEWLSPHPLYHPWTA